jgi:hypothetical protein
VIDGMNVVKQIEAVPVFLHDKKPKVNVVISECGEI